MRTPSGRAGSGSPSEVREGRIASGVGEEFVEIFRGKIFFYNGFNQRDVFFPTMNSMAFISNLAGPDGFLICFFVLIFFGSKRLPELAESMGTAIREFNKAKEELTSHLTRPSVEHPVAASRQELMPFVSVEKVAGTTIATEKTAT